MDEERHADVDAVRGVDESVVDGDRHRPVNSLAWGVGPAVLEEGAVGEVGADLAPGLALYDVRAQQLASRGDNAGVLGLVAHDVVAIILERWPGQQPDDGCIHMKLDVGEPMERPEKYYSLCVVSGEG